MNTYLANKSADIALSTQSYFYCHDNHYMEMLHNLVNFYHNTICSQHDFDKLQVSDQEDKKLHLRYYLREEENRE